MNHLFSISLLLLSGCAPAPQLEITQLPLMIFNTYPANGATLARSDLGELALTFTEDLGPAELARAQARHLRLSDSEGGIRILREDLGNVSYDDETYTLRVELDPEVQGALLPDLYSLQVEQGLQTSDGQSLPLSYELRFRLTLK